MRMGRFTGRKRPNHRAVLGGGAAVVTGFDPDLPIPELSRTTGAAVYPPQLSTFVDAGLQPDMILRLQISSTYNFTGGTTTDFTHTMVEADFDGEGFSWGSALTGIVAGVWYFRERAETGTTYGTWSNIVAVGDTVAPTITVIGPTTATEGDPMAVAFTVDEPSYVAALGADGGTVEIVGTQPGTSFTARLIGDADLDYETKPSYAFTLVATDPAGNVGAVEVVSYPVINDPVDDPRQWNPSDKESHITLSNGNRTATVVGAGDFNSAGVRQTGALQPRTSGALLAAVRVDSLSGSHPEAWAHGFITSTRVLDVSQGIPGDTSGDGGAAVMRYNPSNGVTYGGAIVVVPAGSLLTLGGGDVAVMAAELQSGTTWRIWAGTVVAASVSAGPSIAVADITWHNGTPGTSGGTDITMTNMVHAFFPFADSAGTLCSITGTLGSFVSITS